MNAPVYLQKKWMGDLLQFRTGFKGDTVLSGSIRAKRDKGRRSRTAYHNMGVAEAKLFRFENAKINFIKAYQYTGEESSLFYYYCIMALADGIEAARRRTKDL